MVCNKVRCVVWSQRTCSWKLRPLWLLSKVLYESLHVCWCVVQSSHVQLSCVAWWCCVVMLLGPLRCIPSSLKYRSPTLPRHILAASFSLLCLPVGADTVRPVPDSFIALPLRVGWRLLPVTGCLFLPASRVVYTQAAPPSSLTAVVSNKQE